MLQRINRVFNDDDHNGAEHKEKRRKSSSCYTAESISLFCKNIPEMLCISTRLFSQPENFADSVLASVKSPEAFVSAVSDKDLYSDDPKQVTCRTNRVIEDTGGRVSVCVCVCLI